MQTKVILHPKSETEKFAIIKVANALKLSWVNENKGKISVYTNSNSEYIALVKAKQSVKK